MKILVTGAAGFIGLFVCRELVAAGHEVLGLDNLNEYYSRELKLGRLSQLGIRAEEIADGRTVESSGPGGFRFIKADIANRSQMEKLFAENRFDRVCHLAAQAGVRYSLENPHVYVESNVVGFLNILEGCRLQKVEHLVYAGSSSIYGINRKAPYAESDNVDHPISLYAATKKSNELMAHSYSYLYGLPVTGLRFFTVYGPWGRPDMAPMLFASAILRDEPIKVYNNGNMIRDFTFVEDIAQGVRLAIDTIPTPDPAWDADHPRPDSSPAPFRIYNIGNSNPVRLLDFIEVLERELGRKAKKNFMPIQPGDVPFTGSDVTALKRATGFAPDTPIEVGVRNFVRWYLDFYGERKN